METPFSLKIGIKKNSWYYKYYLFLHSLVSKNKPNDTKSLCWYSQRIFWLSLSVLFMLPFSFFGFLIFSLIYSIYKILDTTNIFKLSFISYIVCLLSKITDHQDYKTNICETRFFDFFLFSFVSLFAIFVIFFLSFTFLGIFYGYFWLKFLCNPALMWTCLIYVSNILFFYPIMVLGMILYYIKIGAVLLFSFILLNIVPILQVIGAVFGTALIAFIVFYICMTIYKHRDKLVLERDKKEIKSKKVKKCDCRYVGKNCNEIIQDSKFGIVCGKILDKVGSFLNRVFNGSYMKVKGEIVCVKSGFGLLVEIIKSMYHGICPMVEYIDEEDSNKLQK